MATPEFSHEEVRRIREDFARGTLNVRSWADARSCSPETIRRVARRDTYRDVPDAPEADESADGDLSDDAIAASLKRLTDAAKDLPPQPREINDALDALARRTEK